jgi:ABC-type glycerol-3-phosphate transport system permease component
MRARRINCWTLLAAALTMAIVPIAIVYINMQK